MHHTFQGESFKESITKNKEFKNSEICQVVSKIDIVKNGDYNLIGKRYQETILGETKYDLFELQELFEINRGGSPRPIKEYITEDDDGFKIALW